MLDTTLSVGKPRRGQSALRKQMWGDRPAMLKLLSRLTRSFRPAGAASALPPRPLAEKLEPRLLYSADLMPVGLGADAALPGAETRARQRHQHLARSRDRAAERRRTPHHRRRQSMTPTLLLNELRAANPALEVLQLDSSRDGIEQIGQALAGRSNLGAVYILSTAPRVSCNWATACLTSARSTTRPTASPRGGAPSAPTPTSCCTAAMSPAAAPARLSSRTWRRSPAPTWRPAPTHGHDNLSGDLDILEGVRIVGASAKTTFVDGSELDRIFDVRSGATTLSGVTLRRRQHPEQ